MQYKLIVGLGNPGAEYQDTYHNVGFLALDAAKARLGAEPAFARYKDLFEYTKTEGMMFVRPLTFMNASGRAVKEAAKMAHADPGEIFVMHDDSDLMIGALKVAAGQNAAGHHGIESIIGSLGSKDFMRARIGIRPAAETIRQKAGEFVLKPIKKKDREALEAVFADIADRLAASLQA